MLKKTITYTDYNDEEVTEDFYFNFTKLEVVEMLELEDLEGTVKRLTKTDNAKEAYGLFKKIILSAYGIKSPDGKGFDKSPEIQKRFESSPACGELIFELLADAEQGALFVEQCLPASLIAQAKTIQAQNPTPTQVSEMVQVAAERQENPETAIAPGTPPVAPPAPERKFDDYSQDELVAMSDEEFEALVGDDPRKMTKSQLVIAMARKTK